MKQTRLLSEISCLSEYTRLYPRMLSQHMTLLCVIKTFDICRTWHFDWLNSISKLLSHSWRIYSLRSIYRVAESFWKCTTKYTAVSSTYSRTWECISSDRSLIYTKNNIWPNTCPEVRPRKRDALMMPHHQAPLQLERNQSILGSFLEPDVFAYRRKI